MTWCIREGCFGLVCCCFVLWLAYWWDLFKRLGCGVTCGLVESAFRCLHLVFTLNYAFCVFS